MSRVCVPPVVRPRMVLVLLALLALLVVAPAAPAQAHSGLVSSDPAQGVVLDAPPRAATLRFNEAVRPVEAAFHLYDPSGRSQPVAASAVDEVVQVTLPGNLADGSYVLGWRVISADSHPISGGMAFSVGEPSSRPTVAGDPQQPADRSVALAYLAAQIAAYLGLLAAVGLTLFEVAVLRSAGAVNRARDRVQLVATGMTIIAHVALLPLTLLRGQGLSLDRLLDRTLLASALGSAPALALALVVVGCSAMLLRPVLPGFLARAVVAGVGAALAVASVLPVGHTRTTVPTAAVMGADLVHTLAGALWFGGVIGLGMFLGAAKRVGTSAVEAAATVRRFSGLAGLLVAALGASGLVLGVLIVGSVPALFMTNYGRTLLVKLGFVAVIGLLALWNKGYLVPAVARPQAPAEQWRRLTGAVRDEIVLLVAVIGVTGLLIMQSPVAAVEPGQPTVATAEFRSSLGKDTVRGTLQPGRVGANTFEFTVRGADGEALSPLEIPEVTVTLPDAGLGPLVATVQKLQGSGRYRAEITVPTAGQWQVAVAVRVDKFANLTARQAVVFGR